MSKKVIDVSSYQGVVDWKKVKASGVDGAILKIIRKDLNPDKQFEANWKGCEAAGVPVPGVYNYSYAVSMAKAKSDAQKVLSILDGRKAKVWMDVEDACLKGKGKELIDIILTYQDVIKTAGLDFGVYTGLSFYNSYIRAFAGYLDCNFWTARYLSTKAMNVTANPDTKYQPEIKHTLEGWQFSSNVIVPGISGRVDMNIWYGDIMTAATAPSGNPYPVPERLLYLKKDRMTGDDVKWMQYHLVRLGFLPELNSKGKSNIDGVFGPDTEAAVLAAQEHYGIVVDGIVGTVTSYVLRYN